MKTHALTILAAVLAVAGCSGADVSTPAPPAGRYIMETANGAIAPAIVATFDTGGGSAADTGTVFLTGDTLQLNTDGTYRESAWFEGRTGNTLLGRQRWSDHGIFTRTADAVHFESEYYEFLEFDAALSPTGALETTRDLRQEGSVDYVFRPR